MFEFSKFLQKGEVQFIPIRRRVRKMGRLFKKKGVSFIFILTKPFRWYLSLSNWCACVFCLFTPFRSVFFAFYGKNLIVLNLISISSTSA